jgi:hypothetical protein
MTGYMDHIMKEAIEVWYTLTSSVGIWDSLEGKNMIKSGRIRTRLMTSKLDRMTNHLTLPTAPSVVHAETEH